MFNNYEYELYIKELSKSSTFTERDNYIKAVLQFKESPGAILNKKDCSYGYKKLFGKILENKPKSVWVNRWLLYVYSSNKYKYCISCDEVHTIEMFGESSKLWDGKKSMCKIVTKKYDLSRNTHKKVSIDFNKDLNIEQYKTFILTFCNNNTVKDFTTLIDSLCQWEKSPSKYLIDMKVVNSDSAASSKFKTLFNTSKLEKPGSVQYNHYLLYLFGYKYCPYIKRVLELDQFNKDNNHWSGKRAYSREAERLYKQEKRKIKGCASFYDKDSSLSIRMLPGYVEELATIYKKCPANQEVDHIVPLNGTNVCGLHVPWNLQYMSVQDNRKKSNKYPNEFT